MKRNELLAAGVLMAVAIGLSGCATMAKTGSAAFQTAVEATWRTYCSSLKAGDADTWIALWDENGIQLPPGAPMVVGRKNIEKAIRGALQAVSFVDFTIDLAETETAGNLGFARGTYAATMKPQAGGPEAAINGKYLTVFKKQSDGSWKIYRDCFNSNTP